MKTRILCFGDSNTWGYNPADQSRYPESVRWTGALQSLLGPAFQIIEEGLNGRTTVFEYRERPGKCGLSYLRPCLDSHFPVDIVILNLGANDTKIEFNRSPEEIAAGLEQLVETIVLKKGLERPSPDPRLILVAPTYVHEAHLRGYAEMVGSEAKTRKLPALYREIAAKYRARFLDLSTKTSPSDKDGLHLEPQTHARIAALLRDEVLQLVPR